MYSNEQMIQKELNKIWGEWKIDRALGEGAYGKVFRITREDFGHTYEAALKVITIPKSQSEINSVMSNGMDEKSVTTYYKSVVEDLVEEFALMAKLKGNTNIVSYEDHAVVPLEEGIGWNIYIRMELLTPLYSFMKKKPMTVREVICLGIDMCQALEVCQRYNIIHRDIKPENVFVSDLGRYKLGDFGIARQLEGANTGMSRKGTYTYMAPEVYKGEKYNSTVDIYSLGIMLYRFLNNNRAPFFPPYPQQLRHSDSDHAIMLRMSGAEIPRPCNAKGHLAEIVLKACAYDPKDRYNSATEMKRALQTVMNAEDEVGTIYPQEDEIRNIDASSNKWSVNSSENPKYEETEETVILDSDSPTVTLDSESATVVLDEKDVQNYLKKSTKQDKEKTRKNRLPLIVIVILAIVASGAAMIISQSAKKGENVKEETEINVAVSESKLVEVPNFLGMSYEEAALSAQNANIQITISEERYSKDVAQGFIMEQSNSMGEKLEEGQTVQVIVSKGVEQTVVPDVIGLKLSKAKSSLEKNNLTYSVEKKYSDSVAKDKIIKQSMESQQSVDVGTEIKLVVSKGKKKEKQTEKKKEPQTEPKKQQPQKQQSSYSKPNPPKGSSDSKSSGKSKTQDIGDWDVIN